MCGLNFRPGRLHGLPYGNDSTVNLLFLKKQIDPSESLSAGHLFQELPVDPEFIPLMHFNSVFNPLGSDRFAGVLRPIGRFDVLSLKLKLMWVHQVPLNLLDLVLSHAHIEQFIGVTHHTLAIASRG